jgi:hypothetical protein
MAKKKKQTPQLSRQAIEVKQKKDFLSRIRQLIDAITGKKIANLLSVEFYEILYESRSLPLELNFLNILSTKTQNDINRSFNRMIRFQKITLWPSELEITIAEYYTIWDTICHYFSNMPKEIFKNFEYVFNQLKPHIDEFENQAQEASVLLDFTFFPLSLEMGRVDMIVEFVLLPERDKENNFKTKSQYIYPQIHKAEWRKFKINNETHSAFQFGGFLPSKGFRWFSVTYENFKENLPMGKLPIPVFIQKHAIERLKERLDAMEPSILIINTFNCFEHPKVTEYRNKYYQEYRVYDHPIGYFIGELIDGSFVIQTFLFITNNGTPEGDKLNKNLGIKKLDKKYLAIDKLSTFLKLSDTEASEVIELLDMDILHEVRKSAAKYSLKKLKSDEYIGEIKNYLTFKGDEGYDSNRISQMNTELEK